MIARFSKRLMAIFVAGTVLGYSCAQGQRQTSEKIDVTAPAKNPVLAPAADPVPTGKTAAKASPTNVVEFAVVQRANDKPRLVPGDVLELKVYQEDELSGRIRVDGDGTVTLPLLGAVKVSGKTVEEASRLIRDSLARDYLFDPRVTLTVAEFAKKRFSVMGEVRLPGFYLIPENETINVLQALSMAGGYTAFSRGTRIQVKRIINGNEVVLWVDAKAMARKKDIAPLEILPGDAITVNSNVF
jgi:protein involved in polysaccharide export with SLBB domain